ncbi:YbfB/YjiJ family MFS transporter [Roseibium sp.]|uniref:YbfB/YjiJ family MFS transporter n=1 Tax=Roseibium sp. TaxID=1936156 RepID=UPI003A97EF37
MPQAPSPVRLAIGGLLSLAAAMGIGRFVFTPILPVMVDALPLSAGDGGYVAAANFVGYLIGALAGSLLRLPGSRRRVFLIALGLSALTTGLMAGTESFVVFCILRFVSGIASAYVLVGISGLVLSRLSALGREDLSALFFAGVGLGIAFSALMTGGLLALDANWQDLWVASAFATASALVAAAILIPEEQHATTQPQRKAQTSQSCEALASSVPVRTSDDNSSSNAKLMRLVIAYGLFGFGYVITMTFLSLMARQDPELSGLADLLWLFVGLSAAPSIWFWNRFAARFGGARTLALACLLEAFGVALSVSGWGMPAMVMAAFLMGGTFMGITALGLMQAQRLTSGDKTRIVAIMTASFGLGQVVGPWVAGVLHERSGNFTSASLAAAVALLAAAALSLTIRRDTAAKA